MLIEGEGGARAISNGVAGAITLNNDSCQRVIHGHAEFQDAVINGRVYTMSTAVGGVTIAAANVVGAANSQPLVGIYNPAGSGYNAVIWRATHTWASGTTGAQGLVWGVVASPSLGLTGAGVTTIAINNFTFATDSIMKQFGNTALTGATSVLFSFVGGPVTGLIAANANLSFIEYTNGAIICKPGGIVGLFAAAAGTSPIVAASIIYEQVPV